MFITCGGVLIAGQRESEKGGRRPFPYNGERGPLCSWSAIWGGLLIMLRKLDYMESNFKAFKLILLILLCGIILIIIL